MCLKHKTYISRLKFKAQKNKLLYKLDNSTQLQEDKYIGKYCKFQVITDIIEATSNTRLYW